MHPERITPVKLPRLVLEGFDASCSYPIFAFPPNRDTLGGTAYLICEPGGNVLVDTPTWDTPQQEFLVAQGGVRWLMLTHRGGIGKSVQSMQQALGCEVVIQEQEAYLLPGISVTPFQQAIDLTPTTRVFWAAGHSPGSSCVYHAAAGGILFSGRHLLPDLQGNPTPLRTAKTFHWQRQIRHTQSLLEQFSPATLRFICPGASLGLLRGKQTIDHAYEKLTHLDWDACRTAQPGL